MNSSPLDNPPATGEHGHEAVIVRLEVNMDNVVASHAALQRSIDAWRSEFASALDAQRAHFDQALRDQRLEFQRAVDKQGERIDQQGERIDALTYELARERRWIVGFMLGNTGLLLGAILRHYV